MTERPHDLRRALARAHAGKSLTVAEATALLDARGDALAELMDLAAVLRDRGHGRTITYSRKVFVPLTMLCRDHCHYCTFAKPPAKLDTPFLTPDEVVAIADAGRRAGVQGGAVHPRRQAGGSVPRRPRVAGVVRIRVDARLPPRREHPRDRGDRPAAAPEPGRDVVGGHGAAEARQRVDGDHAGDLVRAPVRSGAARTSARRTRSRRSGCGRSRTPAGSSIPFTTGILVGIGETPVERAESLFAIRSARTEVPARPGGDRPELPREAGHRDARRAGAGRGRVPRDDRGRTRRARARGERPGAAEPLRSELPAAARCGHQRLGRRLAGDDRPREPRGAVADAPGAGATARRSAGTSCASG